MNWKPHRPKSAPKKIPAWAWQWLNWLKKRKPAPAPPPAPDPVAMYDDVTVSLIPKDAPAVAGYVDGRWRTFPVLQREFPHAKKLPIAVFPQDNADCLDVEPGDATNAQAPAWVKRQLATWSVRKHDVRLPVLYTSASNGNALNDICKKAGLVLGKHYLWWSAHYNPSLGQHICNPKCYSGLRYTAHATQWTDRANNVSLDESICGPGFFI